MIKGGDDKFSVYFVPNRDTRFLVYRGLDMNEAYMAIALAKVEWLYQELAEQVGIELFKRIYFHNDFSYSEYYMPQLKLGDYE